MVQRRRRSIPTPPHFPSPLTFLASMVIRMPPDFSAKSSLPRRAAILLISVLVLLLSCAFLYRAADSITLPGLRATRVFSFLEDGSVPLDSEEYSLERVLMDASMPDKTVILTTLNDAWAAPSSIVDLFLESFRIGEKTSCLLKHLVIIALDRRAFSRCLTVHSHCFALINDEVDFSREAFFMTPDYLRMMWTRIDFLRSILEMGYNFVFTDADIMWLRDPFPKFDPDADFQIACDHFSGNPEDKENIPNGGFKFVRSNNRSIEFYKLWYSSREKYPGLHDQDVLNRIKNHSSITGTGLNMRFLDTGLFGGFCEPGQDLNEVLTMHANCCVGLDSKIHDLRILLEDWKGFLSLPPNVKLYMPSWRVPQLCSVDSLHLDVRKPNVDVDILDG